MSQSLELAQKVLEIEAQALRDLAQRLNHAFLEVVKILVSCEGKVVVSGVGKSGHVGRKIASTLSSTGTPAVFLHAGESSHGDLGVIGSLDVILAISYSGESPELMDVVRYATRKGYPLIALTGRIDSTLGRAAKVALDIGVHQEACPLGLAPTASSTATLAMGDALAMAALSSKGFSVEDFAEHHPGGSLGRRLLTRVRDVVNTQTLGLFFHPKDSAMQVLRAMTSSEIRGVVGILDSNECLIGVITDGDLRRFIDAGKDLQEARAEDLMALEPKTVGIDELAERALLLMEQFRIQSLFVCESGDSHRPLGILHLQDLVRIGIR